MKTNFKLYLLFGLFASIGIIGMSSCGSLTGFQDAKTLGLKKNEQMLCIEAFNNPIFRRDVEILGLEKFKAPQGPTVEYFYRYGVGENVDMSFRCNSSLGFFGGTKVQIIGNRTSKFAMAAGVDLGLYCLPLSAGGVQFPLYSSYQLNDNSTIYCSPKFNASSNPGELGNTIYYFSANFGLISKGKRKNAVDVGVYLLSPDEENHRVFITFGMGFLLNRDRSKMKTVLPEFPID